MKMLRFTGAAAAAVILAVPLLAPPAHADTVGYTGVLSNAESAPITDARLDVYSADPETPGDPLATFSTDADGRYLITGLDNAEQYKVKVTAPGYRTEWWHRAVSYATADRIIPPFNSVETYDFTLGRGSGTITGRISDSSGAGTDATVSVQTVDWSFSTVGHASAADDGRYTIDNLPPGDYKIWINDNDRPLQWLPGKESEADAQVYSVADGQTVVADDRWLALGTVRVVVGDAVTGKPVPRPCVTLSGTGDSDVHCGKNGVVVVSNVPPGYWQINVYGGVSYFEPTDDQYVTVKRGKTTKLITTLKPAGAIRTKVVDSATGAPLASMCVHVVDADWPGQSARMGQTCTGDDGVLEVGPFSTADTINLYAYQSISPYEPPAVRYGDQWVGGAKGGTGDERKALKIVIEPQVTKSIPTIRMDRTATITGVVRDAATGQPVSGVCAFPYSVIPFQGINSGKHCSDADGKYTIDDVGPYSWPVQFTPTLNKGYAWQWSGDKPDRFAATYTALTAGGTATLDANLVKGSLVSGTVTGPDGPARGVLVYAYNSKTRDFAGPTWSYVDDAGKVSLGGQRPGQGLWVYFWDGAKDCWYGSTTDAATPVTVSSTGNTALAIDTTANCAPAPTAASPARLAG